MPLDPNRPPDRPPPTFPYNKISEADTRHLLEKANAGAAEANREKRANAEQNRALSEAVQAQKALRLGQTGGQGQGQGQGQQQSTPGGQGMKRAPGLSGITTPGTDTPGPAESSHTHTVPASVPHHHHHHHHHHPPGSSSTTPAGSRPLGQSSTPTAQSFPSRSLFGQPPTQAQPQAQPARSPWATALGQDRKIGSSTPGTGGALGGNGGASSSSGTPSTYPRTNQIPSPTISRNPGPMSKPSVSPQPAPGRSDIPLFGGTRNLPSPFDGSGKDRPVGEGQGHNRTGSSSSARGVQSGFARSPTTLTSQPAGTAAGQQQRQDPSRSPVARPASAQSPRNESTTTIRPPPPATSTGQSSFGYPYWDPRYGSSWSNTSRNPRPAGTTPAQTTTASSTSQPALTGSAGTNVAGAVQTQARSGGVYGRQEDLQRDHDQAEKADRNPRKADEVAVATASRPGYPQDPIPGKPRPAGGTSTTQTSTIGGRPGYPQEPSLMSQVAPSREPRPYTYKSEILPNNPPPATNAYASRDSRSQMDVALKEQQRRDRAKEASQAKKRKKEEVRTPSTATLVKKVIRTDWTKYTETPLPFPPVDKKPVEDWLASHPNPREYRWEYDGQTISDLGLGEEWVGGLVIATISPGWLGWDFKLKGEKGWEKSDAYSHGDALGLLVGSLEDIDILPEDQRWADIWGTEYCTDDSALGHMLLKGGWIRWGKEANKEVDWAGVKVPLDGLEVRIRLAPRLVRYLPSFGNGLRSRAWGNGHDGWSVKIESVKRILNYRQVLKKSSGRSALKSRIRDFNMTHQAVKEEAGLNGEKEVFRFAPRGVAMYKYDLDAMAGWLMKSEWNSVWRSDLELRTADEKYRIGMIFKAGREDIKLDFVQLTPYQPSNPRPKLPLRNRGKKPKPSSPSNDRNPSSAAPEVFYESDEDSYTSDESVDTEQVVVTNISASNFTWTEEGLIVRTDPMGRKGIMIRVELVRWIRRPEADLMADTEDEESVIEEED